MLALMLGTMEKPDGIDAIDCVNGFHQGDVLASWTYCMTIHPLLEKKKLRLIKRKTLQNSNYGSQQPPIQIQF